VYPHSSWPGLSRPSTSLFWSAFKSWMPATSAGILSDGHAVSSSPASNRILGIVRTVLIDRLGNQPCSTNGGDHCASIAISKTSPAFSVTRKRRKSYPSETHVKRGRRFVHGDVELTEKLGRNDLCPCGSGRRFQGLLHEIRGV
jgi:SEC-C motif